MAEFSSVRPLYDGDAANASAVTRDCTFDIDAGGPDGQLPPMLSIFGGKITTYRKLAEHELDKLAPHLPGTVGGSWTGGAALPGGEMPGADFDACLAGLRRRFPWLHSPVAHHYARL